jgi:hypothetical protein
MVAASDFLKRYGHPSQQKNIAIWDVPAELEIGVIPKRIYCNRDIVPALTAAFKNLIDRGYVHELKTWDGCYNFRPMRGYESLYQMAMNKNDVTKAIGYLSIHSWGCAVDVNAFENQLNQDPKLSPGFVKCFTDAGFDWGGTWKRKDGMHFQLSHLP